MAGFVFVAPDPRLYERFIEGMPFSAVRPTQPKLTVRQLALLAADASAVQAAALMTRGGRRAATYTWHVAFDPVIPFEDEVEFDQLMPLLSDGARKVLGAAVADGGAEVPDPVFAEVLAAIVSVRPDTAYAIDRLRAILAGAPPLNKPSDDEREPVVLYEGDAVAMSLEFVGLDREEQLQLWSGTPRAPFLDGIDEYRVSEEKLLDHDARHFGNWAVIEDSVVAGVTFSGPGGRHLTVLNVNREPVEETLGVDLIYYNHDYDSYVLVQYKRMQRVEGDSEFRPNEQFEEELARMRAIKLDQDDPSDTTGYRLDRRCCFMKLCWPTTRQFHAGEIVPGMYFPLAYWDLLMKSPVTEGPKGGRRVRGNTVGRRLNRTSFVGLVQGAWIGSRGITTEAIEDAIRSGLDADRSLILAAGRTGSRTGGR